VRAGALHWVGSDGKDHFSMGHMIPAIRAQPYMRPAMNENRKPIAQFTTKEIRKALK